MLFIGHHWNNFPFLCPGPLFFLLYQRTGRVGLHFSLAEKRWWQQEGTQETLLVCAVGASCPLGTFRGSD